MESSVAKRLVKCAFGLLSIVKMAHSNPNRFKYWIHKKTGVKFKPQALEFPPMLIVETSSHCDLSCVHCPRYKLVKTDRSFAGHMSFDLFKKIIDEMSEYKYVTLRPFGRGEALMNPDFIKMVRYAKEKGVRKIWLNTNGVLLTPYVSRKLLEANIDRVEVSIDAVNKETFKKIKGKDKYDLVIENTMEYSRLKKKIYPTSDLVVSFVESSLNFLEKQAFIKMWRPNADHINIRPLHQHGALVDNLRKPMRKSHEERLPCSILWNRVEINYSGDLKYCEFDWENKEALWNVKDSSIKEIWNSEKYNELRKMHIEQRFSEIPLCNICQSYTEAGGWG